MVQSVKILLCYRILAQKNTPLLIVWCQLRLCIKFGEIKLVNLVCSERFSFRVIDHEEENGYLIGDRVAKVDFDDVFLVEVAYL